MPKIDVDDLIEGMFGFTVEDKEESEAKAESTSEPEAAKAVGATTPDSVAERTLEEAAKALYDAVKAHTGRQKSVDAWKGVAARAMDRKRLSKGLWQGVLDTGVARGLFTLDETTLSYPTIALTETLEPDLEANAGEEEKQGLSRLPREQTQRVPPESPENWDPPGHLDCGHLNWWTFEEDQAAREEGHCCMGGQMKRSIHYQMLKGKHLRAIPERYRRTQEKADSTGYPGLCVHQKTGHYIGGIGNNCLYANPKGPWCVVHETKERKK